MYDGFYALPPDMARSFGAASGQRIPGDIPARQDSILWQSQTSAIGALRSLGEDVGAWTLDVHHTYDPIAKMLYQGDGSKRGAVGRGEAVISTVAGNGVAGFAGDGGPATQARLGTPAKTVPLRDGAFYVIDTANHRIRHVDGDGVITTVAGTGLPGFGGDGGPATQAQINTPLGAALGPNGELVFLDGGTRLRRIGLDQRITTVAGTGEAGFAGDGGPATQAKLYAVGDIAIAPDGTIIVADTRNNRIRRIAPDGIISTAAGTGQSGYGGDGGGATLARLNQPVGVALGTDGSLYIADTGNNRIRRVRADGIIETVAGVSGVAGSQGDGGPATAAHLYQPVALAFDNSGSTIYFTDLGNNRIRRINSNGIVTSAVGVLGRRGYYGDGMPVLQANLNNPRGISFGPDGDILIADFDNHRVRRASFPLPGFDYDDIATPSEDGRLLYRFNAEGRHLSTVDTYTKSVLYSFSYDNAGRLIRITDADNNVTTIERDASGIPTAIVAPFGQRTTLTVDSDGYLESVTNPAGESYRLAYASGGLLAAFTDPKGNTSRFTYDSLGRLQRDANAAGGTHDLSRTELADGYTVSRTTALNTTATYSVEDLPIGDRQRRIRAYDGTETVTLLGADGSAKSTAPDGTVTEMVEGPDPRFGMQAPLATSQKVTTGGITATFASSSTVTPTNPTDPFSFTTLGRTSTINGRTASSTYTAATRRVDSRSPAGRQSYSILDAKGRAVERGITGIDPLRFSFDSNGRIAEAAQGSGANERVTRFGYDSYGYLATVTDALGQVGGLAHDAAGRVQTQTFANGQQVSFAYDANGNLTSLSPPGRPAHTFTYDAVDQATTYSPPVVTGSGATSTGYTYNADKQITRITRPDGGVLDYSYDAAGRLTGLALPAGQYNYGYSPVGKLNRVAAPGGVSLDYAHSGALLTGATWSGPIAGSVGYAYDNDFRVNRITVNGANPVNYQYDADGLLTVAGALTLTRSSANGLLTGTALGTTTESFTYNSFGELVSSVGRIGGVDAIAFTYNRDKLGRITRKTEMIQGATNAYDYAYDSIGQLIEVRKNSNVQATYAYDTNGNRLSKTGPGLSEGGTYDAQDRMLTYAGATYAYTANGELQAKVQNGQTTNYNYDALGNLRHVTLPNATQIEYLIDGQNRRIAKRINGALVQGFLYQSKLQPVAELDGSGNIVSRFVYATGVNVPDYMIKSGTTYRIFKDHLGSPRLVVNSATGAAMQRMDYDEYGIAVADTNQGFQPFGFAGGIYDRQSGLVRFGARDYGPDSGRWSLRDPVLFGGNQANLFTYAASDPNNSTDSNGRDVRSTTPDLDAAIDFQWRFMLSIRLSIDMSEALKAQSIAQEERRLTRLLAFRTAVQERDGSFAYFEPLPSCERQCLAPTTVFLGADYFLEAAGFLPFRSSPIGRSLLGVASRASVPLATCGGVLNYIDCIQKCEGLE